MRNTFSQRFFINQDKAFSHKKKFSEKVINEFENKLFKILVKRKSLENIQLH